ncbi:MAG TPA: ATP-binding protein [Alphaproteobacteria bacterium]|nr:ATP-binding protein [Alphaproteobacteria bacterium]
MTTWQGRLDAALRAMGGLAMAVSGGRILGINPGGARLLGYAGSGELVDRPFEALLAPDWRAAAPLLLEPGAPPETVQLLRRGGGVAEVELRCLPDPVGVLLIGHDVSDRCRAGAQLLDGVVRFRALMHAAPVGILIVDEAGIVEDCNDAAMALFAAAPGAAIGDPAEAWLEDLWMEPGRHGAVALRRRDGRYAQLELSVNETRHHGRLLRIATLVDVQDRLTMERERTALRDELREAQKVEALGQMASGVAHEFNNLLVPILSMTALVTEGLAPGDPRREQLTTAMEAARLARDLVDRLLSFSRSGDRRHRPVELGDLLRRMQPLLRSAVPSSVALDLAVDGGPHWIAGDPVRLQQAVLNLCTNAAQAMAEGHGAIAIGLGPAPDGEGAAVLTVADDGCGIDPAVLGRIFDPFFTTKAPGEGTGLGLSTVQTIVREHGGRIAVDSMPGLGTTFTLLFPRRDALAAEGEGAGARAGAPGALSA